ncbi:MAG: beta-ketoacyl-[acyl-carrier-protein] synthase II, partial [Dehalococcoidia bacterium]|nr:beta-ketoacyl-[acyl-carrier-protein] synthase II [Dehalococcoidia bacterium]
MILDDDQRIVITGMGVISSLGKTVEEHWKALVQGQSGIRRMTLVDPSNYPCQIAGEVPDFDPELYMERREAWRMARSSQMAVASARLALADFGLSLQGTGSGVRDRIGALLSTGNGSMP